MGSFQGLYEVIYLKYMEEKQLELFGRKKFSVVSVQTVTVERATGDCTVMGSLRAYHAYLASGGYSKYTPDDFTGDVKKLALFLREEKIAEITTQDLQSFVANLRSERGENLSSKTVSRKMSALNNYFSWLVREEAITASPMVDIYNKRITSPLPDILFESECKKLLTTASHDPRTYLLVLLLLETGIKKEELLALKVQHFDFSNAYEPEMLIKHEGAKVKKDRKILLPPQLVSVFTDYTEKYHIDDVLFPYTPRYIELLLTTLAKEAGIQKRVTAGTLRDTCAVRALKRGQDIEKVLARLGLSESTWKDARIKYLKLSARGI